MMPIPFSDDPVLAELRARAARADWSGVRGLADHPAIRADLESEILVSEAELRQGATVHAKVRLQWVTPEAARRHDGPAFRRATNMLGAAHFELGELPDAEAAFERALAEATREGDHLTAARATNNLGMIANMRGQHDTALALYRVAIPAYQQLGYPSGIGETSHNIAITLRDLGQFDEAERYERRAIEFATDAGNRRLAAIARVGRADVALKIGEAAVAATGAQMAAAEFGELGDQFSEADALRVVAQAQGDLNHVAEGLRTVERVLVLAEELGATLIRAEAHRTRAELLIRKGDRAHAAEDVAASQILFGQLGATAERERLDQWWMQAQPR